LQRGQRLICINSERLPEVLGLNDESIQGLLQSGLVRLRPQNPRPKECIDYVALQQVYRRILAKGSFSSQTELARHLEVSRVSVSRVFKEVKKRAG
jgi:response regulator of citrate/malate metabolism